MVHGRPDWLLGTGRRTTYRWAGFDEMAVRLGSPVSFDRRGDVILVDSFEDGKGNWVESWSGAGGVVDLSVFSARTGAFSLRMMPGSDSDRMAAITRTLTRPVITPFGIELSFTLWAWVEMVRLYLTIYSGTDYLQAGVRYLPASQQLQVLHSDSKWHTVLGGLALPLSYWAYNTVKLVTDFEAVEYKRLLLNEHCPDVSGYAPYSFGSGYSPRLNIELYIEGEADHNPPCYVDDIILTQIEP